MEDKKSDDLKNLKSMSMVVGIVAVAYYFIYLPYQENKPFDECLKKAEEIALQEKEKTIQSQRNYEDFVRNAKFEPGDGFTRSDFFVMQSFSEKEQKDIQQLFTNNEKKIMKNLI